MLVNVLLLIVLGPFGSYGGQTGIDQTTTVEIGELGKLGLAFIGQIIGQLMIINVCSYITGLEMVV